MLRCSHVWDAALIVEDRRPTSGSFDRCWRKSESVCCVNATVKIERQQAKGIRNTPPASRSGMLFVWHSQRPNRHFSVIVSAAVP